MSLKVIIKIIRKIIKKGKPQFGKIKYKKNENMRVFCNPEKAKKKLKWVSKVKIVNGISKTIKYYKHSN
jgi:dTDP-D-glucose 4,6-dehydratase